MSLIPGIKQISQVGNDMYIQGAFPVGAATTEVDYLADPADTRLLAGRDPVIDEVSVGMIGSETGIETASGAAPLQITDAMHGMLRFLETNIKPVQDLNGYANPWPAGGGANKWDEEWEAGRYNYITGVKEYAPGTIRSTNKIPVTANTQYFMYNGSTAGQSGSIGMFFDADENVIENIVGNNNYISIGNVSFTTPANAAYMVFYTATATYNNNISVNYPATVTTYSPYANICPIQGWTGCNVFVSPTTNQADATVYPCTWQDDAGTVYGGLIDLVSGWMTVTHKMKVFTGDEGYTWSSGASYGNLRYASLAALGMTDWKSYATTPERSASGITSQYKASHTSWSIAYGTNNEISFTCSHDNYFGFNIGYALSNVNTWLASQYAAGTPLTVCYELATPQYIQVQGNQILTQEGTNYIWTDCGDTITAAYVAVK